MEREHCGQTLNAQVWLEAPLDACFLTGWSFWLDCRHFGRCIFTRNPFWFSREFFFFPAPEDEICLCFIKMWSST